MIIRVALGVALGIALVVLAARAIDAARTDPPAADPRPATTDCIGAETHVRHPC